MASSCVDAMDLTDSEEDDDEESVEEESVKEDIERVPGSPFRGDAFLASFQTPTTKVLKTCSETKTEEMKTRM